MQNREERLARFAQAAVASTDVSETLRTIVQHASLLVGAEHAGITLRRGAGRFETVAETDDLVSRADQLQYELAEGPCVVTATDPAIHVVLAADVGTDSRWRRWGPRAADLGVRSVLSAELRTTERLYGALNLYGNAPRQFSSSDAATGHLFAVHASVALAGAVTATTLSTALQTRTRIGQAQGILMERFDLDADHAFAVLRRYSQTTNTKLIDVADELIQSRQLPPRS